MKHFNVINHGIQEYIAQEEEYAIEMQGFMDECHRAEIAYYANISDELKEAIDKAYAAQQV